jgi:hypothetical protein
MRLRSQRPQNQPLPFPADHVERCVQAATLGLLSYSKFLPHGNSYYGEVSTVSWASRSISGNRPNTSAA